MQTELALTATLQSSGCAQDRACGTAPNIFGRLSQVLFTERLYAAVAATRNMLERSDPTTTVTVHRGDHGGAYYLRLAQDDGISVEFSLAREEALHKNENLGWVAAKRRLFNLLAAFVRLFWDHRKGYTESRQKLRSLRSI
jgi:hypothetical protein